MYTVEEAYQKLRYYGLTRSIQVVRRWIREGHLQAEPFEHQRRKAGYRITDEALLAFIQDRAPGIAELMQVNERLKAKQNKGNITNEILNDPDTTSDNPEQPQETIQERYEKVKIPFKALTEDEYERIVYSAASLFIEVQREHTKNAALQQQLHYYRSIVEEEKTDPLERQVLKALGVSIRTILKGKNLQDRVSNFRLVEVRDNKMAIQFLYRNQRYTAYVQQYEHPSGWFLKDMRKFGSSRRVQRKTMKKVEHHCLQKTFERMYRLEQRHQKGFQYFYNFNEYQLNHI